MTHSDEQARPWSAGARQPATRTFGGQGGTPAKQAITAQARLWQSFKRSQRPEEAYHNPSLRSTPAGQGGAPAYQQAQPLQGGSSCLSAAGSRRQQTIARRRTAPTHSLTRTERVSPTSRRAPSSRELLRTDSDERPRAGACRPTARTLGDQGGAPIKQASRTSGKAAKFTVSHELRRQRQCTDTHCVWLDRFMESDRAGQPDQPEQAGAIHSRTTQGQLGAGHNGSTRMNGGPG